MYVSLMRGSRRMRILVVDDDLHTREMLAEALQLFGAEVRAAADVAHARTVLDGWLPDVLVSDVDMPGEGGYDFIRKLRRLPRNRGGSMPAIAFTGYARDADRERALDAGYQEVVAKPVDLQQLLLAIARVSVGGVRRVARTERAATASRRPEAGYTASSR
jgi:two-component system CheB/CheR fusion protein